MSTPTALRRVASLGAAVVALWANVAGAEGPPAEAFEIYYYVTDDEGNKSRRMTLQDLQQFVNKARCECVQNIVVDITLRTTTGVSYDQVQLTPFIGTECSLGQEGFGAFPCAKLEPDFPMAFTKRKSFEFAPIWLGSPTDPRGPQGIGDADALYSCAGGQGTGGLWLCSEDGMVTDCQAQEFIIQGTQNNNIPNDQMGQGIQFDFEPPIAPPTEFDISEGDGAVEISWELGSTADIAGYRILCAEKDGSPVSGKGAGAPDVTAENNGTMYFTAANLCPDGAFNEGPNTGDGGVPIPPPGGTGTGTGGDTGTPSGTTTGALWWNDEALDTHNSSHTGTGTSATGTATVTGTTGSGTGSQTGTGTGSGTDAQTGTATGSGMSTGATPPTGMETLDWAYVCSGHIPGTTTKGRVSGLVNKREYDFMVVAYDKFGNPAPSSVLSATPIETNDLWENCENVGDVCGESGFCSCRSGANRHDAMLAFGVLLVAGGRRRRRLRA